jgi:hypothetical protein
MIEQLPSPKKTSRMYAIQRLSDGAWSRGGAPVKWGKMPKTWGAGPFKNHVGMFRTLSYMFNVDKFEETKGSIYPRYANPDNYEIFLLHKTYWPYFNCEVVEFDPSTLGILQRYPAHDWIWDHCYRPFYERERCFEEIKNFCKVYKKDF